MIRDAITTYLADPLPESMLLIAAPAGIGKTTIGVEVAEAHAASGHRAMYVGPRKEFYADLIALAQHPSWWYLWQARHGGDTHGLGATCRWPAQIATWQQRGYDARTFCSNPRICGWHYIHTSCRYYAQEQQARAIIYAQYEHIAMGHPLLSKMSLIIGDELPVRAFLAPWHIPARFVVPEGIEAEPIAKLVERLYTLSTIRNTTWRGPELIEALGGAEHVERICRLFALDVSQSAYEPTLRHADSVEDVPYFHLPWLLSLLRREAERAKVGHSAISRVKVDPSGLTLLLRRASRALPPHVIWLDATANTGLYETLFRRPVKVVRPDVALTGRVRQVWAGLNNKYGLNAEGMGSGPKIDHVKAQIARILSHGYERPAYISYKDLVRTLAPHGAPDDALAHFGGARGTNRLQDCDCLIVVGAPQPPIQQLAEMAAMLYHERDEPFDLTWSTSDRPFACQPWAWPIGGFWNDPDMQTLLEQCRELELVQAIHRARPLIRNVDVWLLTNVPIADLPVELVSLRELFDAPEGVDPYRWPAVVSLAEERLDATGIVTTADLIASGLCQKAAGRRYIELLASQQGWRVVTAPADGRGRPPIGCVKDNQARNKDLSPISNL